MLLEFDAEIGGVRGVLYFLTEGGRGVIEKIDGRIVFSDEMVGRVFGDQRLEPVAGGEELLERAEAKGVAAVVAIGRPRLDLHRIERGLGDGDGGAVEARGLAGDGIGALGIGEVVVEGEPEAGAGTGRTAGGTDPSFVEVPGGGLAADELQGARGIVERGFDGRRDALGLGVLDEAVVDRDDGDALGEEARDVDEFIHAFLFTALPTAAVNDEDDGRGRGGSGAPEIKDVALVRAVADLGERGFDDGRIFGGGLFRGFRFGLGFCDDEGEGRED